MARETIDVVGARTNNLRDVSVSIPKGQLVAFTGVSGSGKTSLAIDTLHNEAQLRYLEGLSPFVRQYITQRNRPKVDRIVGLGATLAVDQRRLNRNPRSTVATITGIDGHLGLLYSRLPGIGADPAAENGEGHLTTAHFDRNTPEGGCADCHGVGGRWRAQEDLVITHPELPLFDGASPWYAKWRSGEHAFVPALAEKRGVDLDHPWRSLPEEFRHCVLYGTGDEKIEATIDMTNKNETALVTYTSTQPLRGALAEVERVFVNAQTSSAKQRYLPYMRKQPCDTCGGSGYDRAARSVRLGGLAYPNLLEVEVREVRDWAKRVADDLDARQREVGEPLLQDLGRRLGILGRLGLDHLQLSRGAATLSAGELQRTRLAAQLSTELSGIIFVLDEPGAGLHPADKAHLLDIALELCAAGNTVLLVEHDPELIARADWVIDMGPGAGRLGGEVLVSGPPADAAAHPESLTGRYLAGDGPRLRRSRRPAGTGWVELHGLRTHNVTADLVRFPAGRLTCLTGVSGSGKSSLLGALGAGVEAALNGTATDLVRKVTGLEGFGWSTIVDQEPLGRTPRSTPATYSKAFDIVRKLFAETDVARRRAVNASWFSYNTAGGGRCETCTGYGRMLVDMHFLPDVWVVCDACEGRRYKPEALEIKYRGLAIDQVLELTVAEAVERFPEPRQLAETLGALNQVGLGYLQLGQSATELSGGEAQRLRLASAIQRGAASRKAGLIVLDEPVSGLHPSDVQRVVDALDVLLDSGNTIVVAEHDISVAASADWVIDLGPGAGPDGGAVVAEGTPDAIATADTPTAGFFRRYAANLPLLEVREDARISQ